jgi:hypothetical protein
LCFLGAGQRRVAEGTLQVRVQDGARHRLRRHVRDRERQALWRQFRLVLIGSYSVEGEEIVSEMMMSRHNHDPAYAPMYPVDNVVMTFRSHWQGDELHSRGGTAALPGVVFESVLTPINDTEAPPAGRVCAKGIRNGLYSIISTCSTASMAVPPAS